MPEIQNDCEVGLTWGGAPDGLVPPPSWDYGAFFDLSADIVTFQFYSAGYARLQKVIQQRSEEKKEENRTQEIFRAIVAFYDAYGNKGSLSLKGLIAYTGSNLAQFMPGGDDDITVYKLPGDLDNVYGGRQGAEQCVYYALAWVDHYLGSTKGKNGGPRNPGDFQKMQRHVTIGNIGNLLDAAGMEHTSQTVIKQLGEALAAGHPVLAIEYSGDYGHAIIIVEIDYDNKNYRNTDVKVYNPISGFIESRYGYFSPYGPSPKFFQGSKEQIIINP